MRNVNWVADYMVTALGCGTDVNANAILNYKTGIKPQNFGENHFIAAPIDWSLVPLKEGYTKLESLMIFCVENVKSQVNKDLSKAKIIFSTTKGNVDLLSQGLLPEVYLTKLAENVAHACGIETQPIVISNACISGISALIMGSRLIQEGQAEDVIVVGGDLLTEFVVTGFQAFKSVSANPCIPYDQKRDGLSMGEACGVVLLSKTPSETEDPIFILSGAITNDANHISGPSRTGDGLFFAINSAIKESGIEKVDISFVSAHGTATVYNDEMESKAINLANLSEVLTNSLKPYFGHTLGACGVIESILSVWQLKNNIVFGTKGFETLGTPMPLNISAKHSDIKSGNACLKIASGFGGCNAAMILSKSVCSLEKVAQDDVELSSVASVCLQGEGDFSEIIRQEYKSLNSTNLKFFKMDNLSKLGYVCAEKLLSGQEFVEDKTRIAIILSNKSSSLDTDIKHQELLNTSQPASPAIFVYTLANIVSGEICIKNKIQGENTFIVQDAEDGFSYEYAKSLIGRGTADFVIYGWCELLNESYKCKLELLKRK